MLRPSYVHAGNKCTFGGKSTESIYLRWVLRFAVGPKVLQSAGFTAIRSSAWNSFGVEQAFSPALRRNLDLWL